MKKVILRVLIISSIIITIIQLKLLAADVKYGDVNLDGEVNSKDLMFLTGYLSGSKEYELKGEALANADLNLDGNVDLQDQYILTKYLEDTTITLPIKYGDINMDGEVNVNDITYLDKYFAGLDENKLKGSAVINADVNLDGEVNVLDKTILEKYFAKVEGVNNLPVILYGDVNLDGKVNVEDRTLLSKYFVGQKKELSIYAQIRADVDLNGRIEDTDDEILAHYLAKWKSFSSLPVKNYGDGDVNADGVVNIIDATQIKKYLNGYKDAIKDENLLRADVNQDGLINEYDCVVISRYLARWNGYELPMKVIKNLDLKVSNSENKAIISGFSNQNLTVNKLLEEFKSNTKKIYDINGKELTGDTPIGTGAVIKIDENDKQKSEIENGIIAEYNVVLYGDVTGDGKINAVDALALIKDINNKISLPNEIYREAGRIISDNSQKPSAVDVLAIIKSANGKYEINQVK